MCGRFTLSTEAAQLQQEFSFTEIPSEWKPRYNIAPGQDVAVISNESPDQVKLFRWGLIPYWAKEPNIGYRMINARSETVGDKPAYREAYKKRRCLVLADGFYEWQHPEGKKLPGIPYYFCMQDRSPFAFAGLWERWQPATGMAVLSCTIVTTQANELVNSVHDRMPVILDRETRKMWLSGIPSESLNRLMQPLNSDLMKAYTVSRLVNRPDQDSPSCIAPEPSLFSNQGE